MSERKFDLICPACNQVLNNREFYLGESIICLDGRHYGKNEVEEVKVKKRSD